QLDAGCYTFENGHSVIWNETPDIEAQPLYQHIDEIRSRVGDLKAQWMMNSRNMTIYPNVQIADTTSLVLRTITPIAVDKTEMNLWCLAIKGEDAEVRRNRIRQHEDFFNVSGMATPDDTICYEDCQDGGKAWATEWLQAAERGIDDMHPGGNEHSEKLGFKPAWSVRGLYKMQNEVVFHAAYRQWAKLMEAGMRREHNARMAAE
ncbi:MAG: SRPBCC family protein, partial [Alphaproteobacteria bacterium]